MSDLGQHSMFGEAIATHAERRSEARFPIIRTAKLVYGDVEMPCVLRDISNSALRVRIYDAIPADTQPIELEFVYEVLNLYQQNDLKSLLEKHLQEMEPVLLIDGN